MYKTTNKIVDPNNNSRIVSFAFSKNFPEIIGHPLLDRKDVKVNSNGYRSDEFTRKHKGVHVLFSGCSTTYGDGLNDNETWAQKVYDKLSSHTETSGFFNIGTPGQGITYIIFHIFKYIEAYGKPDVIFINFPVSRRFVSFDKKSDNYVYFNMYKPSDASFELWQTIPLLEYQYLFMLEKYCKSTDTLLVYGTWDQKSHFSDYNDLEFYIDINDTDKIASIAENTKEDKFSLTARDGIHYGTAFHTAWAEIMYNEYMNRRGNDR